MKKHIFILLLPVFFTACKNQKTAEPTASRVMENVITLTDAQIKNAHIETGKIEQK